MSSKNYSVREYAKLVGYSPRYIYKLIRAKRVRAMKVKKRWVITYPAEESRRKVGG